MAKLQKTVICILLIFTAGCKMNDSKMSQRLASMEMSRPQRGIMCDDPASSWEEGLITGNGTIGLTILSHPQDERIIIGHEELFLPLNPRNKYVPIWKNMKQVRALILNHKSGQADALVVEQGKKYGYFETVWTNPLVPAGEMQFQVLGQDTVIQDYLRSINYETGEAIVSYKTDNHVFQRKMFVSRDNNLAVMKVFSPDGAKINCRIRLKQLPISPRDSAIAGKSIDYSGSSAINPWIIHTVKFRKLYDDALNGVSIVSKVIAPEANLRTEKDFLVVENADSLLVLTNVKIFKYYEPINTDQLKDELNAITTNYDLLLANHEKIHSEMYNRISLTLGSKKQELKDEDDRLVQHSDSVSLDRIEDIFNACRYEMISSTGKLPPTLQGIWGGTWRPAWSSDFTQDGNVQAVITGGLSCNYFEVTRAYLDYMSELLPDFRNNAKEIFNARGIWVPSRTSEHGQILHFNKGFPGLFWMAGAAWVTQFYYDYWKYSEDSVFLEKQAIPFMLEAARFYEDYLVKDKTGTFMVIPSYSPENVPLNEESASVINATMDVAAIRLLLMNLLEVNKIVPFEEKDVNKWKEMLAKLPAYQIDEDGALKEWLWPSYKNYEAHRHASHLYPLYFGVDPLIKNNPELAEACKTAIEKRLEYRRKNNGGSMAFGIVQLGMSAANLKDTLHAEECIHWLCKSYWTENLNSYHDPGKIFNVDISGGMPAIVVQMLLQSNDDTIELLPVLPRAWDKGEIKGIRAKGGFLVNIAWENNKLKEASVVSLLGNDLSLTYQGRRILFKTNKNEIYTFTLKDFT